QPRSRAMPITRTNEESIFAEAPDKGSLEERDAYLDEACKDDAALRARVENLLRSHEQAGSFLRQPPAATSDESVRESPGTRIGPYKLLQQIPSGAPCYTDRPDETRTFLKSSLDPHVT